MKSTRKEIGDIMNCQRLVDSKKIKHAVEWGWSVKPFHEEQASIGRTYQKAINCHVYSFKLWKSNLYLTSQGPIINSEFVNSIITDEVILPQPSPIIGCLAIYFKNGIPTHSGILKEKGRIESKFGGIPAIFTHPLLEVGEDYGEPEYFSGNFQGIEEYWANCRG